MRGNARLASVCAVLLALAAVMWWQLGDDGAPSIDGVATEPETEQVEALRGDEPETSDEATDPEATRQQVEGDSAPVTPAAADTGSLLVRVVFGEDGSVAAQLGGFVREAGVPKRKRFRTDDAGEAVLEGLRPGRVVVLTDLQRMQADRTTIVAGQQVELTITLKGGVDITGIVVNRSDTPIPGATVVLAEWAASEPRVVGLTDAAGRFFLRQASRMSNVAARAPGYAPSPCHSITAGEGAKIDVRIVLPGPGGSVHGEVQDPDGQPVADALVKIGVEPPFGRVITLEDGSKGMYPPQCAVRTDARGRFEGDGLPPGEIPVAARAEAHAPWTGSVEVIERAVASLVIRLVEGVTCEGTVTDEAGEPMAGISVEHGQYRSAARRDTKTAADGSYRLEGLPAGKIVVRARGDNRGNASRELQAGAGETVRWDVTLSRGLVLTGVVRNDAGQPLKDVMIEAFGPYENGKIDWFRHVSTDEAGNFELTGCPRGPVVNLRLHCKAHATLQRVNIDATSGPLELTMVFHGEPTGRIVGTVFDPDGQPVGSAQLSVGRAKGGGGGVYTTTAEGKIDIGKRSPGTYWLRISAGSYAGYMTESFDLAKGETKDLGGIHLSRGGRVRVALQRPAGTEEERLYLPIYQPDGRYLASVLTDNPKLISDPIPAGRYELRVTGPRVIAQVLPFTMVDGQDVQLAVEARFGLAHKLEFELPPDTDEVRRIHFTVTGTQGYRLVQQKTRYRPSPFSYELGLEPGRYTVTVRSDSGHTGTAEFEVAAGGSEAVRIPMK